MAGRELTALDKRQAPQVAIVNETLARKLAGTTDAVGYRFREGKDESYEIVGVVENGKYQSLTEDSVPAAFFPILQKSSSEIVVMARSKRSELELASEMRRAIIRLTPNSRSTESAAWIRFAAWFSRRCALQ